MEENLPAKRRKLNRPVYSTLLYYVAIVGLTVFFNVAPGFKSGPCTPGLDFLFPFLALFISVCLLLINGCNLHLKGKAYLPSLLIHAAVILVAVLGLVIILNDFN